MKSDIAERTVLVPLPATFIDALLTIYVALNNNLTSVLETGLASCSPSHTEALPRKTLSATKPPRGKYTAEFLGVAFTTRSLPEVFAKIVDITAEVAPEALDSLLEVSARTRRFVARKPEEIHPGRHDLPVMQTYSN